jgi:hypothetical protein
VGDGEGNIEKRKIEEWEDEIDSTAWKKKNLFLFLWITDRGRGGAKVLRGGVGNL